MMNISNILRRSYKTILSQRNFGINFGLKASSYECGLSNQSLLGYTLGAHFDIQVDCHSNKTAVISKHQNIRLSYKELQDQVLILARGLLALGIRPGDRVGIWSPNNVEWLMLQLATAKMGAILVNINPAYKTDELEYALNLVECNALFLAQGLKTSNFIDIICDVAPEIKLSKPGHLSSKSVPHLRKIIRLGDQHTSGMLNFAAILQLGREDISANRQTHIDTDTSSFDVCPPSTHLSSRMHSIRRHINSRLTSRSTMQDYTDVLSYLHHALQFDDAINIQFTSGTTGRPKGATLTHHNILNNGYFVGEGMKVTSEDIICVPVPLYHCFGMVMGNICALTHGATIVYPSEVFDVKATLQAVLDEKCTALYGVPTMFIALLEHPNLQNYLKHNCLRTGIMAGSICPSHVMQKVQNILGMKQVTICYGMTETSPVSTQTLVDDELHKQVATVGKVHPHLEVKIIDMNGSVVPRGTIGEFCTRGYSVMKGYWNNTEKTKDSIDQDGWMHTGDLAAMDSEGYITIEGRLKDMIIRGGENVYPKEVEDFLYRHPFIQDVQIVSVPDDKYGEEICAWVILKPGMTEKHMNESDESEKGQLQKYKTHSHHAVPMHHHAERHIRHYCKQKFSHYKTPRYFHFVDNFPLTITGKVKKYEMRDMSLNIFHIMKDK